MSKAKTVNKGISALEAVRLDLETLRDEEQEKHDNRSERWQESEAGEKSAEFITQIEAAIEYIESAEADLSSAVSDQ